MVQDTAIVTTADQ